ncbi:tail fiber domain-containing protein [Aquimarina longa]|uniref:tail fiber domain-containing protein n=1 Tax=Aquimarina longa TaxID=1080221 RepID=UPI0007815770|nr:tail fiber domain-containing protein [Aquimarina longa]
MSSNKENRKKLKTFFEAGDRPTEAQFSKLINSVVVQQSDKLFINNQHEIGLGQDPENGKRLTILGEVKINNGGLVTNGGGIKLIENGNGINLQPDGVSYFSSDKIGIGVEDPNKKLHIRTGNEPERAGATPFMIENSEPNNEWVGMLWRREGKRDWGVYSEDGDFSIWQSDTYNSPSGSYPFVIKENGNIGIGTTDPDAQLCVHTSSGKRSIMLEGGTPVNHDTLVNIWNLPPTDGTSDGTINFITSDWNNSNGLGLIKSAYVASPVVWMYEFEGRNAFTVARKRHRSSGQDASKIGDDLIPLFQIRENGNVGIGTVQPQQELHIQKDTNDSYLLLENTNQNPYYVGMQFKTNNQVWGLFSDRNIVDQGFGIYQNPNGTGNISGGYHLVVSGKGNVGIGTTNPKDMLSLGANQLNFNPYIDFGNYTRTALIKTLGGLVINIDSNNNDENSHFAITKDDGAQELFKITDNGNIAIGETTIDNYKLTISGSLNVGGEGDAEIKVRHIKGKSFTSSDYDPLYLNYGTGYPVYIGYGGTSSSLEVNGKVYSQGSELTSDKRFKKNIDTLSGTLVQKLTEIRGVSYEFDGDNFQDRGFDKGIQLGVIAQEVKEIFPQLVTLGNDGFYTVNYNGFIPLVIEAIKKLQLEINKLKNNNKKTNLS